MIYPSHFHCLISDAENGKRNLEENQCLSLNVKLTFFIGLVFYQNNGYREATGNLKSAEGHLQASEKLKNFPGG